MSKPPIGPRSYPKYDDPTWQNILVTYALVGAIPIALWIFSQPITGIVVLTTSIALFFSARGAHRLTRCYYECQQLAFEIAGKTRITVTQLPSNDPN
ncbi:hypothetical protein [Halorussus halophilus]|uniref:hypothetical protein n=1 Tax=Halorussus halophilus TaxID=2650975 RepID=UPI0013011F10|nr:hypothetical protein [Halorussus halophilus]